MKEELLEILNKLKEEVENTETTNDKIKEINRKMAEKSKKNMEDNYTETTKNLEKLRKDARCIVAITDIGAMLMGTKAELLSCFSALIEQMREKGFKEQELEFAFNAGIKGSKAVEEELNNKILVDDLDKFNDLINEILGE